MSRRYEFGPEDELPFTGVLISPDGKTARPIYGDGSLGAPEPDLLGETLRGELGGHLVETYYEDTGESLYAPWPFAAHATPFGLVDDDGFGVDRGDWPLPWMNPASLAESRRRRQGHYGYYDYDHVRAIILNEGVEYGVNGYTAPEHFVEPLRGLGIAVRETVQARDDYLYDQGDLRSDLDEQEVFRLARAAESAKESFCHELGVDNEPWEGPE